MELLDGAKTLIEQADADGRDATETERTQIEGAISRAKRLKVDRDTRAEMAEIGRRIGVTGSTYNDPVGLGGGAGDTFVKSEQYRKIANPANRGSRWSSGPVEVKATLLEGQLGSPGTGGALVQSDVRPGIAPTLFQPLSIADLIPSAPTSSNKVRVIVESVATNAAAVVPEGGTKPESTLEFSETDEPVRKVATFLPVSDELISDAPGIQSYLNSRLALFVRMQEEAQLLQGAGGSNLEGLYARVPAENLYVSSDADAPNSADHIYEAITVSRRSYLEPDTIVVHPDDWADLRLLKATTEEYIGGSPFGNGLPQPGESLWGKRVVVTTAANVGSALVGALGTGAQLFRRGGLTVEASNSHSDWFKTDLIALRAETRLALHVARPESLVLADLGYSS